MNARHVSNALCVKVFIALLLSAVCFSSEAEQLPSSADVLARILARASAVATNACSYAYEKRSLVEELNSHGKAVRSTEKVYKVALVQGWSFSRLIKVQGQPLSEAEIRRENQREQEFRNKIAGRDLGEMAKNKENWITPELLARYHFKVLSKEPCRGRPAILLEFKPKSTNPQNNILDRIFDRLAGRIWVDEEDAEIAKLDVHLTEELSLGWLGMLGSLKDCRLEGERGRMPDGTWVNARHTLLIVGRKLLGTMRYRTTEESNDFRQEPPSSVDRL